VAVALVVSACGAKPIGREGYAGEPVRAAIVEDCNAELLDADNQPCVQIDVFAEGTADQPTAERGDWVVLHYIVEVDGKPIDSSHDGKPLRFKLGESHDIIDGMHRGVRSMRVGERRRFVVPPRLGYRGQKVPGVPPKANLVFLVELMERRGAL
jgi:FKBP-type peptidyl-prolyl cis-trans isomerase